VQIRRVVAGLPLDSDTSPTDVNKTPEATEASESPFKKPILPPTPATA
jgi:hypothetical protein